MDVCRLMHPASLGGAKEGRKAGGFAVEFCRERVQTSSSVVAKDGGNGRVEPEKRRAPRESDMGIARTASGRIYVVEVLRGCGRRTASLTRRRSDKPRSDGRRPGESDSDSSGLKCSRGFVWPIHNTWWASAYARSAIVLCLSLCVSPSAIQTRFYKPQ